MPDDPVEFISEPIVPERGSFSTDMMTRGLAALPGAFEWRGRRYEIVECLEHVKQSMHEGYTEDGERESRRQQFVVVLDTGQRATIYVERQGGRGAGAGRQKKRWYLYTIEKGQ